MGGRAEYFDTSTSSVNRSAQYEWQKGGKRGYCFTSNKSMVFSTAPGALYTDGAELLRMVTF